jgi:hypothetical protein
MMRTWSIAGCIDRVTIAVVDAQAFAAVAVQGLIDVAHTVERVSRPVRRERDGADELAEREAEEEVGEPGIYDDPDLDEMVMAECRRARRNRNVARRVAEDPGCVFPADDDIPNPTEPSLSDDELVAVRQLIEERFPLQAAEPLAEWEWDVLGVTKRPCACCAEMAYNPDGFCQKCSRCAQCMRHLTESGAVEVGQKRWCPECYQSSPVASATSDSGGEVASVIPPDVPSSPRPPWSDLADAMVEHKPAAKAEEPDVYPVICGVLAKHQLFHQGGSEYVCCAPGDRPHVRVWSQDEWRAHVAPLIAEALEPHRIYVKRGPMGEPVPVELRPEMVADYNTTHCCRYCGCAGLVAHFDNCNRPNK